MNLITNIGYGGDGTHTNDSDNPNAELPRSEIINMKHPDLIESDILADMYSAQKIYNYTKPTLFNKIKNKLKSYLE